MDALPPARPFQGAWCAGLAALRVRGGDRTRRFQRLWGVRDAPSESAAAQTIRAHLWLSAGRWRGEPAPTSFQRKGEQEMGLLGQRPQ